MPKSFIRRTLSEDEQGLGHVEVHAGNKLQVINESRSNLITVFAVLATVLMLSLMLSASMREQICGPLVRIVEMLEMLIHDPMHHFAGKGSAKAGSKTEAAVYEVEKAIDRVGVLLRLGLGEAGAKIISQSMQAGKLDIDKGGEIVQAIFGFCDIRNFTDCTEVLRADIVRLVNAVAVHVHTSAAENHGAANKNIGDAFLLVWKPKGHLDISTAADASLRSYIRVIIALQTCPQLRRIERRAALQERYIHTYML